MARSRRVRAFARFVLCSGVVLAAKKGSILIAFRRTVRCVIFSEVKVHRPSRPTMRGSNDGTTVDGSVELAGSVCRTGHAWFRASADGRSFSQCFARRKGDEMNRRGVGCGSDESRDCASHCTPASARWRALPPTVQLELNIDC